VPCGMPLDPAFLSPPDRSAARQCLGVEPNVPLLLVLFGGTGFGKPRAILRELARVARPFQAVLITGRNERLRREAESAASGRANYRIFGWVDNMHEWLAAADFVLNKPSGLALLEAMSCGVPFLALDPLPGNERRHCELIERWGVGRWVRSHADLALVVEELIAEPDALRRMGARARSLSRPRAAYEAAEAILKLLSGSSSSRQDAGPILQTSTRSG
jgi:processive 1,2-diacylglycerol beta-glucosyltransferase